MGQVVIRGVVNMESAYYDDVEVNIYSDYLRGI